MTNIIDLMQLCRLCLVKDKVNVPIFDEQDTGQILLKISACLPVKVSKEDSLPKNICDGCSSKLDTLYQFWKISANSEKQLLKLLNQLELDKTALSAVQHSINSDSIILKQEVVDIGNSPSPDDDLVSDNLNVSNDGQDYLMPQQQMPYQFDLQPDDFPDPEEPAPIDSMATITSKMLSKKRAILPRIESDEEDVDDVDMPSTKIAKTEELSDESENEAVEPTTFVPTNDIDNEQPGPSGIGKSATVVPFIILKVVPQAKLDKELKRQLPVECEICHKTYENSAKYKTHRRCHQPKTYKCRLCEEVFEYPYGLKQHKILFHDLEGPPFKCNVCPKEYATRDGIRFHLRSHTNKYPYKCDLCGNGYNDKKLLEAHHEAIHEGTRFKCEECGKTYAYAYYLKQHMVIHEPGYIRKVYQCEICSKELLRKTSYDKHMRVHNGTRKQYICDYCGKVLLSCPGFKDHLRVHKGEKPCVCEYCGKAFVSKKFLDEHELTHSKKRRFMCEICSKGCISKASLLIHIRSHTGEKPYDCNFCGKAFSSTGALNFHKKSHGTPLKDVAKK